MSYLPQYQDIDETEIVKRFHMGIIKNILDLQNKEFLQDVLVYIEEKLQKGDYPQ